MKYNYIYLSPHYDDAVLSCGGLIHSQCRGKNSVLVITIFGSAAKEGEPRSDLGIWFHDLMGNPSDETAIRQEEDRKAMAILGADYHWLNYRSGIYRGQPHQAIWYYPDREALFGSLDKRDSSLVLTIAEDLYRFIADKSKSIIYCPLAVGNHVDHQLSHLLGWNLHEQGFNVAFYEDFPYCIKKNSYNSLETATAAMEARNAYAELVRLNESDLQAHIDGACAYTSQFAQHKDKPFKVHQQMIGEMVRPFFKHSDQSYKQRLWHTSNVYGGR